MPAHTALTLPFACLNSGILDYNDPAPGSDKPRPAVAFVFFGNDRRTNEEIWLPTMICVPTF